MTAATGADCESRVIPSLTVKHAHMTLSKTTTIKLGSTNRSLSNFFFRYADAFPAIINFANPCSHRAAFQQFRLLEFSCASKMRIFVFGGLLFVVSVKTSQPGNMGGQNRGGKGGKAESGMKTKRFCCRQCIQEPGPDV